MKIQFALTILGQVFAFESSPEGAEELEYAVGAETERAPEFGFGGFDDEPEARGRRRA